MAALWLREGTDARLFASLHGLATNFHIWLAEQEDEHPAVRHILDALGETSPIQSTVSAYSRSPINPLMTAFGHTVNDGQVCGRPPTKSRSDTNTPQIYKWVDENGQTHMSDKRPEGHIASAVDLGTTKQDFTYEIIPDGVALPLSFQGQLAASSKRMYDIWSFFLGEENLRQSTIQLLLMGDPNRFDAYYAQTSPSSGNRQVAGFYSIAKNQAVVKYDAKRPVQNMRTTFHEVSHLITASHLGPTPPWLTEGLAEYFEMMEVAGQGGVIHPNQAHIKRLRTTALPSLENFLAIAGSDWYGEHRERNYAIAWSLINFLMGGSPGRYALQDTINESHEHFCKPFSAAAALGKAYPGGIRQLEVDWRQWLATGKFDVQQT